MERFLGCRVSRENVESANPHSVFHRRPTYPTLYTQNILDAT